MPAPHKGFCKRHQRKHHGEQGCIQCYNERRKQEAVDRTRSCAGCGKALCRGSKGVYCSGCMWEARRTPESAARIIREEARVAPATPPIPRVTGSWIICSDIHAPWHDPEAILEMCDTALLMGCKRLIVAGDVIHGDTISKYIGCAPTVPITKELESLGRLLAALEEVFDEIVLIPGNHDQRVERMIASMRETKDGRRGLEMVASLLGAKDVDDAEDLAMRYLKHFFNSPKVTWHALPDLVLNDTWLIQHPGTVSRIPPQSERAMVRKHRKSVIQGHSHLFGLGFDESGQDVALNIGHMAKDDKWRYMREKPTTFPKSVQGFAVIYQTKDSPGGRLIPIALHNKWFRLRDLAPMFVPSTQP